MSIEVKHYRQEEVDSILDNADLTTNLTFLQGLRVCCWLLFNYDKVCQFCNYLDKGVSTPVAYIKTVQKGRSNYLKLVPLKA